MTGYFELVQHSEGEKKYDPHAPLMRDVETLPIYAQPDGSVTMEGEEGGTALYIYRQDKTIWLSKLYICHETKDTDCDIYLSWSYNNFSRFMIDLLAILQGKDITCSDKAKFGQVFDKIYPKPE
jgi:hypothetical protein